MHIGPFAYQGISTKMTFQLLYSSDAHDDLDEAAVDDLIELSRHNNVLNGISGMLIYMNRCFLQLLEGEESKVRSLFDKISRDPRHTEPFVFHEQHSSQKSFGSWTSGYRQPTVCEIGQTVPSAKETARTIQTLANNKPLWIRSAVKMFGETHAEIGHLYHHAQGKS